MVRLVTDHGGNTALARLASWRCPSGWGCPTKRCAGGSIRPRSIPGPVTGYPTDTVRELRELKRRTVSLRNSRNPQGGNEFLRAGERPATPLICAFIAEHRARFGVAPICRVLSEHGCTIAPRTFYAWLSRPRLRGHCGTPSSPRYWLATTNQTRLADAHQNRCTGPRKCGPTCNAKASRWPAAPWNA